MQVKEFVVAFPSMTHQKNIADTLSALDDRITLLRETNATLEAIAQALFKSWFVDFDPVRAKAEGREPEGVPAEVADLFPSEFEESELGDIPKGWSLKPLVEFAEILNGFAFKSDDYVVEDDGVFVLRTTNFNSDGYAERLNTDVFMPANTVKIYTKYLCEEFDFHLVMVGASVGKTSTLLPHMLPALRNQNMWCFRPKNDFASKFLIHSIVQSKVAEALRSTSGSAREFLRKGDFEKNMFAIAPVGIIEYFEMQVKAIKSKIASNANQSDLLEKVRDTLLPRLMSGKLRIPDLEEQAA
jgi:type I restriction enzyme S subunit